MQAAAGVILRCPQDGLFEDWREHVEECGSAEEAAEAAVATSSGNGPGLSAAPFAMDVWSSPEESQQHSDSILYCSDSESTADLSPPGDAREDFVRTYRETTFFLVLYMVLSSKLLDPYTFLWSMRLVATEGLRLADPLLSKYSRNYFIHIGQNHLQLYMDLVEECASAEEATEDAD
jgi:hypothetical protein